MSNNAVLITLMLKYRNRAKKEETKRKNRRKDSLQDVSVESESLEGTRVRGFFHEQNTINLR